MILFGSTLSPFVRKVAVFAQEKGIALELQPTSAEGFAATSPFRKMPGFSDGDFRISDSTAIITYLDAKFPEPNLIPHEPQARARTIWFEELADTIVTAAGVAIFFNRFVKPRFLNLVCDHDAADTAEREGLPPILDYLESVIPPSGFLVEDRFTLADISVASPFATIGTIGVTIDPACWPRTAAYVAAIHARPSFAGILANDRALVDAMGGPAVREPA
jgi:glutathione S-transferase